VLEGVYEAVQFHTHIGSEHVIGGQRYGAELHIVHKEQGGNRFAVVGIMLNGDGAVDNPTFGRLLDKWSAVEKKVAADCAGQQLPTKNRPFVSDSTFNVYDLVPLGSSFYHYDGSLTTPPCSEVVWWNVADTPLTISPTQYDRLVKMTTAYTDPKTCELTTAASPLDGTTNRPIAQDISGRKVKRICPVGGIATAGEAPQTLEAMADATPALAEVVPTGATLTPPTFQGQTLMSRFFNQPATDDYDPYRGL
jgi:Eukaryotic-type carbonic anhydrase